MTVSAAFERSGMRINDVSHILYRIYDRDAAIKFFVDAFGCELLDRGTIIYAVIGDVLIEMINNDPAVEAEALGDRCGREGIRLGRLARLVLG
jgi:catechol 2,3-dioxygenase-like lactoylglutathione lyase family enzyme